MKTLANILSLLIGLFLLGCASNPAPAPPTTYDEFCGMQIPKGQQYPELYKWERAQEKRVSLEGYLALPTGFNMASNTFTVLLFENPNRQGKSIRTSMKLGSGRNRLKSPGDRYKLGDLQAKDAQGNAVNNRTKVRVHGKRLIVIDRKGNQAFGVKSCFMTVDLVETVK